MKKLLYLIFALEIAGVIFGFIAGLSVSFVYACLYAAFGLVGVVPTYALIKCLDYIDELKSDVYRLEMNVREIKKELPQDNEEAVYSYGEKRNETAPYPWICTKCDSINKEGITTCATCGADFNSAIHPPLKKAKKKKPCRWL